MLLLLWSANELPWEATTMTQLPPAPTQEEMVLTKLSTCCPKTDLSKLTQKTVFHDPFPALNFFTIQLSSSRCKTFLNSISTASNPTSTLEALYKTCLWTSHNFMHNPKLFIWLTDFIKTKMDSYEDITDVQYQAYADLLNQLSYLAGIEYLPSLSSKDTDEMLSELLNLLKDRKDAGTLLWTAYEKPVENLTDLLQFIKLSQMTLPQKKLIHPINTVGATMRVVASSVSGRLDSPPLPWDA